MTDSVPARIAAIQAMSVAELKAEWRRLFETDPPAYNRRYLESRLVYRVQELLLGGLTPRTVARLEAMGQGKEAMPGGKRGRMSGPVTGTCLVREWRGVEHRVVVQVDGFAYEGKTYKSLSAIARSITKTQWSGPVFFGLKRQGRSS